MKLLMIIVEKDLKSVVYDVEKVFISLIMNVILYKCSAPGLHHQQE